MLKAFDANDDILHNYDTKELSNHKLFELNLTCRLIKEAFLLLKTKKNLDTIFEIFNE